MSTSAWLSGLSIFISTIVVPGVLFLARNWFTAWISKSVQHHFDTKIEEVRAELRKKEEHLKSDLRDRESEIAALRNTVLSGSASRQSLLDKRRFDAVEKLWTAVRDLDQLKHISQMMAIVNVKEVSKELNDPRMQTFLSMIGAGAPEPEALKLDVARFEQPFLSELAWAYFLSYKTILHVNFIYFQMLKSGVGEVERYLKNDETRTLLKTVLPHQSKYIDENEPTVYHYLLEEIEGYLLAELRKILEGKEIDQASARHAKEILDAVHRHDEQQSKEQVEEMTKS